MRSRMSSKLEIAVTASITHSQPRKLPSNSKPPSNSVRDLPFYLATNGLRSRSKTSRMPNRSWSRTVIFSPGSIHCSGRDTHVRDVRRILFGTKSDGSESHPYLIACVIFRFAQNDTLLLGDRCT